MGQSALSRGTAKIANRTNNCGGNKKAGLPSTLGHKPAIARAIASKCFPDPNAPFVISRTNQHGGIGRVQSMMSAPSDGINLAAIKRMQIKCNTTKK